LPELPTVPKALQKVHGPSPQPIPARGYKVHLFLFANHGKLKRLSLPGGIT